MSLAARVAPPKAPATVAAPTIPAEAGQTVATTLEVAKAPAPAAKPVYDGPAWERPKSLSAYVRENIIAGMSNKEALEKAQASMGIPVGHPHGAGLPGWHRSDLTRKNLIPKELQTGSNSTSGTGGAAGMRSKAKIKAWKDLVMIVQKDDPSFAKSIMEKLSKCLSPEMYKEFYDVVYPAPVVEAPIPGATMIK